MSAADAIGRSGPHIRGSLAAELSALGVRPGSVRIVHSALSSLGWSVGHASLPAVIAITGIMAAGKSTVAQALAERFDRSVHVRGDLYRRMIVRGRAPIVPDGGGPMAAEIRLRQRLAAMVADGYAREGYTAVVQDIMLGADLARFVELVESRPLGVVVLAPRPDVVAAREQARPKTGYGDGWTVPGLDAELRRTPRIGLWLDSSGQTPEQTVDEILARLPEAVV